MGYTEAQYAIDGIISGLNLHAKTGLEPPNVNFTVIASNQQAKIRFTAGDTVVGGMVLASTKGVIIRRKIGSAPTGPNDGTLVGTYEGTELTSHVGNNAIIDAYLTNGQRYYYRFFPYTGEGVYNYSSANIISVVPKQSTIWGFHQDFNNLDPDSSITYIEDAVGYTPAHHNSDTGTVTDGSWGDWEWLNMNKPYVVTSGGRASYQLDPEDFSKKLDGTPSGIADLSTGTGCFAWINKIYMKEVYADDGNSRDVYFSMDNTSTGTTDFKPVGFMADADTELEGIWIPMFYGDVNGATKPGTYPAWTINNNDAGEASAGQSNRLKYLKSMERCVKNGFGENGCFFGGPIINVLRDIMYLLYKSTNVRKHAGEGRIKTDALVVNHADATHDGRFYGRNRSAALVNRAFFSEVINSFQLAIVDPYTWFGGNGVSSSGISANAMRMMPYYKNQLSLINILDTSTSELNRWDDVVDMTGASYNQVYSGDGVGEYFLCNALSTYEADYNLSPWNLYGETYFNTGYRAYIPSHLIQFAEYDVPLTEAERTAMGTTVNFQVSHDAVTPLVKKNHLKPFCGSTPRFKALSGCSSPDSGLCTALIHAPGNTSPAPYIGMVLRFGGCSSKVTSAYEGPYSNMYFDFHDGQIGGDYAGIAFMATLGLNDKPHGNVNNTDSIAAGCGWGYAIMVLPPSGYSPVTV